MSGRPHYNPSTDDMAWHDPNLRGPSEGWHSNPRAEFLRDALVQIAECKSLTATSAQFAAHLQRLACKALTADVKAEPDWCNVCNAPQMVLPSGEHACGVFVSHGSSTTPVASQKQANLSDNAAGVKEVPRG